MEMRPLGRTGVMVSSCCLGTMTWGQQNTEAEGHAQMDAAIDRGVNFFDVAEMYPIPPKAETQGRTEEIIGTWFEARKNRDKIVLATKVSGRSPMNWTRDDAAETRVTAAQIDEALEKSLKRLKTDYVDLYQIHWPDRGVAGFGSNRYRDYDPDFESFEDQLSALAKHVEAGRVRFIGVSNETPWGVMKFLEVAERRGWPRIASIQNAYSLVNRTFERGLAEVALREKVGLLAYSPLAQGYLTGKYRDGAMPGGSRKALFQRLGRYERVGAEAAINAFLDLAKELGVAPEALAIRFCDTRVFTTATIIGATSMAQLTADLAAFDLAWTSQMEDAVNHLNAAHRSPCP